MRDDEQPRREQPDGQLRRLLIEAEYEYDFQRVP